MIQTGAVAAGRFYELRKEMLWKWMRKARAGGDPVKCLRHLLPAQEDIKKTSIEQHFDELAGAEAIRVSIEKYKEVIGKGWDQKLSGKPFAAILFDFVALRLIKPRVVVETGCAAGWTSTLLLYALHLNGNGHLYSIDIPPKAGQFSMDWSLPEGLPPGFLVPDVLRQRWTLILGDTREHLMPLLRAEKKIDVFYHDSDHSYPHMMWEYTSVWPYLNKGGLLISDDIGWNTAFWDFATAVRRPVVIHKSNMNFGAISKVV